MFNQKDLFQVGRLGKSFGTQGNLKVSIFDNAWVEFLENYQFVFVSIKGDFVPFRIKQLDPEVIEIDKIMSPEEAIVLAGKNLYVPIKDVDSELWEKLDSENLLFQIPEWRIFDSETQKFYESVKVEEYPQQTMASFAVDGKMIYLPLNDQTLERIDLTEKTLFVKIDADIWDLYI